jgi:serine/threonine-protein kinase HipA
MQQALVLENGVVAGTLMRTDDGRYTFRYNDAYLTNPQMPPISLTLPKTKNCYEWDVLFPFFYGL